MTGPIEFTDLPWETPPLVSTAMLDGVPLHMMFESRPPLVDPKRLFDFWNEAMVMLRVAPARVATLHGWTTLAPAMPKMPPGVRKLWVALPRGFPSAIDDYAGLMLSLECAHLLRVTTPLRKLVESPDDYYVETEDGIEIGVRDGLPIVESTQWDVPATGMVMDLLRLPRGDAFIGCDYDLISKLRSVGHRYRSKIAEAEGVDWALQALRILAQGRNLPEVQRGINSFRVEQLTRAQRRKAINDALELAHAFSLSDRSRVLAIRSLLVPEHMTVHAFKAKIYSSDHVPAALSPRTRARLQQGLEELLQEEETKK